MTEKGREPNPHCCIALLSNGLYLFRDLLVSCISHDCSFMLIYCHNISETQPDGEETTTDETDGEETGGEESAADTTDDTTSDTTENTTEDTDGDESIDVSADDITDGTTGDEFTAGCKQHI